MPATLKLPTLLVIINGRRMRKWYGYRGDERTWKKQKTGQQGGWDPNPMFYIYIIMMIMDRIPGFKRILVSKNLSKKSYIGLENQSSNKANRNLGDSFPLQCKIRGKVSGAFLWSYFSSCSPLLMSISSATVNLFSNWTKLRLQAKL